ncbi:hypothetical protein HRbin04_00824 [archaeon HR04]|jgi:predicted nuclease of predicted toxin-antitoxin system|nr:hypothetical protein HRbin04_00824 [archaeon HR04]
METNRTDKLRFIADENVPLSIVRLLRDKNGIEILHITEVAGKGLKDTEIIALSAKENSVIITFDKDFGELVMRNIVRGSNYNNRPIPRAYGVVILRIKPLSIPYIYKIIRKILSMNLEFEHKLIVVKEDRIRIIPIE